MRRFDCCERPWEEADLEFSVVRGIERNSLVTTDCHPQVRFQWCEREFLIIIESRVSRAQGSSLLERLSSRVLVAGCNARAILRPVTIRSQDFITNCTRYTHVRPRTSMKFN